MACVYSFRLFIKYSLNTYTVPLPRPFILLRENDKRVTFCKEPWDGLKDGCPFSVFSHQKMEFISPSLNLLYCDCFHQQNAAEARPSQFQTWLFRVLTVTFPPSWYSHIQDPKTTMYEAPLPFRRDHVEKTCGEERYWDYVEKERGPAIPMSQGSLLMTLDLALITTIRNPKAGLQQSCTAEPSQPTELCKGMKGWLC